MSLLIKVICDFLTFIRSSNSGQLAYPLDIAWSDSGVGGTKHAKVEPATPKLPVIELATGVNANASEAGADADVQLYVVFCSLYSLAY